ncbi:MAG TPA: hypothetical protein PKC65_07835 [Pyrinomonadaceae bacterium]|nr:hypothetical protein [Pyrinomonadaceae bacterium]
MRLKTGIFLILLTIVAAAPAFGQRKRSRTKRPVKKPPTAVVAAPKSTPEPSADPPKLNSRPASESDKEGSAHNATAATHIYVFERPGFTYPRIEIRHDDAGKGVIIFEKIDLDEPMDDPIELSDATVNTLNAAFTRLDFVNSTEDYDAKKVNVATGTISITLKQNGRSRTATFRWSDNPDAKLLMDEYRRISNEAIWKFEMQVARENQPLETPRLMARLSSLYESNELPDPPHLLPLLKQLANDEILPLIARNDAERVAKAIEKAEAKRIKKEEKGKN